MSQCRLSLASLLVVVGLVACDRPSSHPAPVVDSEATGVPASEASPVAEEVQDADPPEAAPPRIIAYQTPRARADFAMSRLRHEPTACGRGVG